MREPSGQGIRGPKGRGCLFAFALLALFGAARVDAQAITFFARDTGNINFVTTGGSLRNSATQTCNVNGSSTTALSGVPPGTTIRTAYLYWGGSGSTVDSSVRFNNTVVNASRTFTRTFVNGGTSYPYFGGFADVTSIVTTAGGNANYTFTDLTINTGTPHCTPSAVVGGWALFVIYEGASERLRAINIYDGLDYFFGSQVVQNPTGFRVPPTNIDGRIAVFTLEGDPANSGASGGFSESLRFNGVALDDGIDVPGSVPQEQQFDGTINTQGIQTSYGIDVDLYDVSALLAPGETSATTTYSSGDDLVLLMAQVVSATSEPAVDLAITKTHSGTFVAGGTGTYEITVSNVAGAEREDNTVTVTDVLPAGLTYNSFSGTGWSCGNVGQTVTCTHPPTLNAGASFPVLSLVVNVLQAAAANVTNTVSVSTPSYEVVTANNSTTDPTATLDPNLSTSTKTVIDLNGGDAAPGDVLRYTVTLTESAGGQAVNVSLVDSVPGNVTFDGFVSIPAGASSSFAVAPAGDNNTGQITVSNITVPASGSVTVVFDVLVNAAAMAGATIDNEAVITNPNGADATPNAPQVVVLASQLPTTGIKFIYLRQLGGVQTLTRNVPTGADQNEVINSDQTDTWTFTPALQQQINIPAGAIPVRLWLSRSGGGGGSSRNFTVTLSSPGFTATTTASVNIGSTTTASEESFSLGNAVPRTFPAGTVFTLTVRNNSNNSVTLWHNGDGDPGNNSRIELDSQVVINVDSVQTYNAAFPGGVLTSTFVPGNTVFVRAQISDPFGSFDISSARITLVDPNGVNQVADVAMTEQAAPATCSSTSSATCVFQYQYTVPANAAAGTWTARVIGFEGSEGTVEDLGIGTFLVALPSLTILKSSTVVSDPLNNTTNPKRIPLSVVRYDITVTNGGLGYVEANSLAIIDAVPANSVMFVSTTSGNPVVFVNGSTPSGLTYNYATNVTYSSTGVAGPWTYNPVPDANGYDPNVRAVRVRPGGVMNAASGVSTPGFTVQFRVRVN